MLTLQRLQLANWCQHESLDKTFGPTTTGIIGQNGSGKSNMVAAIHYALRGTTLSNETLESCINFNADSAKVKLWFAIDGKPGTITRTLTAKRREDGLREACKTTAVLSYGEDTITGVKKVQDCMTELLNVRGEVLTRHVFISQDALNALLFSAPAENMNSMIMLMPEISRAEWLRGELAKELTAYPEITLATPVVTLMAQRDEARAQVEDANANLIIAEETLREFAAQQETAQTRLAQHSTAVTAKEKLHTLEAELQRVEAPSETETEYQQAAQEVETLSEVLTAAEAAYQEAHLVLKANKEQEFKLEQYKAVTARKRAAEAGLAALVAPVKPAAVDHKELETRIAETTGRIQNLEAWLRRCEAGDTVCPTCGQPLPEVPEEKIEAEKAILKHMKSDVAIATRALATARQAETEYAGKQATYAAETKALEATIVAASAELTALAIDKAVILTEDQLAPYEETVSAYDVASAQLSAATSKAAKLQALLATSESRRSKLESQIAVYREQLSGILPPADEASCRAIIEQATAARADVTKWTTVKSMAEQSLKSTEAAIAEAEVLAQAAETRNAYRSRIEAARTLLHRDNLPMKLLARKSVAMQDSCNRFLQTFGSPFALNVAPDMSMTCTLASGHEVPIQRLSGGQRAVMSVCMRFAINELFSRHLGLLVLDEPSANMDRDNVVALRRLFEQIHDVSLKTGVQTVVITHHSELLGAFDGVISV